jgi:hypothetical protein
MPLKYDDRPPRDRSTSEIGSRVERLNRLQGYYEGRMTEYDRRARSPFSSLDNLGRGQDRREDEDRRDELRRTKSLEMARIRERERPRARRRSR